MSFGLSGTHVNTILDESNGKLKLKTSKVTDSGIDVYVESGYWESDIINLGDNFKEFGKLFITDKKNSNSTYSIETRTSSDGILFNDYVAIAMDGAIQSEKKQYVQVKITLYAGYGDVAIDLDKEKLVVNEYVEFDSNGNLKQKTNYEFEMVKDESWTEDGEIHIVTFDMSKWEKVNSLSIE